ncbi:hypothetical protein [Amycolatopsis tucumanensis]|uniref:RAMA domain-containing protein n=1 Tax=Amycolatopsis tucumanensis TaxID=401106 RepID=A0ABP7JQ83_9PSEU|nr:hypothetical protein [Amycolatopsis tucumanensis]MCF6424986.1 hypothetical protein [Amycolatopsis tucumanensis]
MTSDTCPNDPTVPPTAVALVPAPPGEVPLRAPADTWALVVTTVRLTLPQQTDTPPPALAAELFAGVWLPVPPPAEVHRGDVAVRLHPPADGDPARTDVEVLTATPQCWRTVHTLPGVDTHWPHDVAAVVVNWMRALADEAERKVGLRLFSSSIGRAVDPMLPGPDTPDALTQMIDSGLVAVGEQLGWNGHTATVGPGGALVHGTEPALRFPSAVSALATWLARPATVNGWYLWRRTHDDRPLVELRAELATASRSAER